MARSDKTHYSICLFDFDGTITSKDSLVDFTQYVTGKRAYYLGLLSLSPMLISYKFNLIPNHIAKQKFISHFFKGRDADQFMKLAYKYSLERIDKITRPQAIEKIRWHKEHGHKVVIVSASMECWLKGWCEKNELDLIATRLEVRDGVLTGKFATRNCHGIEKVNRVREVYDLNLCDQVYSYGDSRGDRELLELADMSFYKPFREK